MKRVTIIIDELCGVFVAGSTDFGTEYCGYGGSVDEAIDDLFTNICETCYGKSDQKRVLNKMSKMNLEDPEIVYVKNV